jgi:hypothetical protein
MSRVLKDIDEAKALAVNIARNVDDMGNQELALRYHFLVNYGIMLMQDHHAKVACQVDKRGVRFWYHNLSGNGWEFFHQNTKHTKYFPAFISARVLYPQKPIPIFQPNTLAITGYNVDVGEGAFQYSPCPIPFTKTDLEALLTVHVTPRNKNKANALHQLLRAHASRLLITAAPHTSSDDDHFHITVDAGLKEGQIHIGVVNIPPSATRRDNTGFPWVGLLLMFVDSYTRDRMIRNCT